MRITSAALTAALAAGALAVLAGCSASSSPGASSALPAGGSSSQSIVRSVHLDGTGVAPKFLRELRSGFPVDNRVVVSPDKAPNLIAVDDAGTSAVEIINKKFHHTKTITNGINGPDGNWYDSAGNLYVANYAGVTVQEYPKGGTSPSFTYTTGLIDPINVNTDSHGNVYVADYNFGSPGFVAEYAQKSNTMINQCSPGGAMEGLAVDPAGDVFVSYNNSTGSANIAEYVGGLSGCHETVFSVTQTFAGGMVVTRNGTLAACDQLAGAVDIIPAPYTSITGTITGFTDPFHDALNKLQNTIYVADASAGTVSILSYPGGTLKKTLGSAQGITLAYGVAKTPH